MSAPKIAIIFYSTYGTNRKVAETAATAARDAGADVRVVRVKETAPKEVVEAQDAWKANLESMSDIPEATLDDMEWADGYFFCMPTRFGVAASQMRAFIDTLGPIWQTGGLVNKTVTASASAQNPEGGQTPTLLGFYTTAMHWGSIIVAPGYADPVKFEDGGTAYGLTLSQGEGVTEVAAKSLGFQARRLVEITARIANRSPEKTAERAPADYATAD